MVSIESKRSILKNPLPNCVAAVYRAGIFSLCRVLTLQIQNKSLEKWCQDWGVGNSDDALRSASAQRGVRLRIQWQEYSRSQEAGFATWTFSFLFFFSLRKEIFWKLNISQCSPSLLSFSLASPDWPLSHSPGIWTICQILFCSKPKAQNSYCLFWQFLQS